MHFNSRPSARGDTLLALWRFSVHISIHAPPRGATMPSCLHASSRPYFNSRPSARGDEGVTPDGQTLEISIHAPPRGATVSWWGAGMKAIIFQFTPLREGRRDCDEAGGHVGHFNSRPSARGDATWRRGERNLCISIHAPPRGATGKRAEHGRRQDISIHAPPRGATAKDMQFLQIFCSTLTNQHGLTIVPRNLSRLFW